MPRSFQISEDEYQRMSDEHGGFCVECGEEAFGVEPDARKYVCESCEERGVYGIEELLLMGLIELT